jgi:hypothetical protein
MLKDKKPETPEEAEARAKKIAEDIKKIDNIPHLNNWWKKHEAEVNALPDGLSKKVIATWYLIKGEIEGKLKDASTDPDTKAIEPDAERGDGEQKELIPDGSHPGEE